MLTFEYNEKQEPIKINFIPHIGKTLEDLKFVVNNRKPLSVIKTFLKLYLENEAYSSINEAERRYVELLNENIKAVKETVKIPQPTEDGGIEEVEVEQERTILDLDNLPEEAIEIEEKYPHIKKFRETGIYEPPQVDINTIEVSDEVKQLIKEYNRWYFEEFILSQGYKPKRRKFKVYCKFDDLILVKNAIDLAELSGATKITLVTYGGKPIELDIDDAKNIIKEAGEYTQSVFQKKVYIRENMIKPAKTGADLLKALESIETGLV